MTADTIARIWKPWTPYMIQQLRELAKAGHSASMIAMIMGDGMTKNAVIGKAWREGIKLSARPGPKPEDCRRNIKGQFAQKDV